MNNKVILSQITLSLFPFLLSQVILALVLHYMGFKYFNSLNWMRWDSGHYLQIAKTGYEFFPCAGNFGYPSYATEMCGNTGWFPGYPLLIKFFSIFFKDTTFIAGIISKVFYLLTIFMVIRNLNLKEISPKNMLIAFIATFSFGFIYYNAIFPISSVLFFVLAALYFYNKDKIWLTSLFCFLASIFYPTGFLLSIVFSLTILLKSNQTFKQKFIAALKPSVSGALGVLFVFVFFQITVTNWAAFLEVQAKYGHNLQSPLKNMLLFFKLQPLFENYSINSFIQYQSLLIIVGYIGISILFFVKRMYKNELYLWSFIYTTLFFIFPWIVSGDLSRYRSEALLLPSVILLKEIKTTWLAFILLFLLGVGIPMSYLFFTSVLV